MTVSGRRKAALATFACAAFTLFALGCIHRESLVEGVWLGLLRHGSASVRARAAAELARRRSPGAAPYLVRALREDSSTAVRYAAGEALGALGPDAGETAIRALVEAFLDFDETPFL